MQLNAGFFTLMLELDVASTVLQNLHLNTHFETLKNMQMKPFSLERVLKNREIDYRNRIAFTY